MQLRPPIIGLQVYTGVNDNELTTSLAPPSWVTHTTLSIPATNPGGRFLFWVSAEWSMDDENNPNYGEFVLDGTTVLNRWVAAFKKKYDVAPLDYYYPLAGMHEQLGLSAGAHTLILRFAAGGGKVARMRHGHIYAWRIGD